MKNFILVLSALTLFACGKSDTKKSNSEVRVENREIAHELLANYIALKDAFVTSSLENIQASENPFISVAAKYDVSEAFAQAVSEMQSATDVEAKRTSFSTISNELYVYVKTNELGDGQIFYQYCPMAFGNTGAYWLSSEKQIANPYFGDRMLRYGTTKETL